MCEFHKNINENFFVVNDPQIHCWNSMKIPHQNHQKKTHTKRSKKKKYNQNKQETMDSIPKVNNIYFFMFPVLFFFFVSFAFFGVWCFFCTKYKKKKLQHGVPTTKNTCFVFHTLHVSCGQKKKPQIPKHFLPFTKHNLQSPKLKTCEIAANVSFMSKHCDFA